MKLTGKITWTYSDSSPDQTGLTHAFDRGAFWNNVVRAGAEMVHSNGTQEQPINFLRSV
jgi:hypothetical protein